MFVNLNNLFICINVFVFIRGCIGQDIETTVKTLFVETTTEFVTILTDIPEEDVEEALNIDYGRYTTQSFQYINSQFDSLPGLYIEPCYDSHIKCLITVVVPQPVCTVNDPKDLYEGYRTFDTYCDAYLDNCLRRMRFWRILDFGRCAMDWEKMELYDAVITRKKNFDNFKHFFNLLLKK